MAILSKAPEGAKVLDLEAGRIARAEARAQAGEGNPIIKLSGNRFVEVKAEFSISVAIDFQNEDIKGGLAALLVDPADVDALLADGLSQQDIAEIAKFISGLSLGE
jgi:hypothetical protein